MTIPFPLTSPSPLSLVTLSPTQWSAMLLAPPPGLLGAVCLGSEPVEVGGFPLLPIGTPVLNAPNLGAPASLFEAWFSAAPCHGGECEGIRYRADGQVLYGVLAIAEEDVAVVSGSEISALQRITTEAYQRIFRLLDAQGYPQLWRVWNYLADINVEYPEAGGLERYRQFNVGRQEAFLASGRHTRGDVPAACALGVRSGPLSIAFIAGRTAALPLENPRQISAWDYPGDYGPRAPTFSRGALAELPGQALLFISGTASIVGHRTMHLGDVVGQVREAMANIDAVLGEANRSRRALQPYTLADLDYRVYVRQATDFDAVRATMQALTSGQATPVYVQADICRADLLVEIEAITLRETGAAE